MSNKVAHLYLKQPVRFIFVALVFCVLSVVFSPPARAHCIICHTRDCNEAIAEVITHHTIGRDLITTHITNRFDPDSPESNYPTWLLENYFIGNILPAMMMMTEQLSAVGMYQMQGVGMLLDAKIQMETQRTYQELQVDAIREYHPSENFCYFGSNMRSLSASQNKGMYNKMAMNKIAMDRLMGFDAMASAGGNDMRSRWEYFRENYCQVYNNNWSPDNPDISGLEPACNASADSSRANADVDYGRYVDSARTLDVDFTTGGPSTNDEMNVISLMRNLYGHRSPQNNAGFMNRKAVQEHYYGLRGVAAKRNIAMNSFNSIVGMKTAGTSGSGATNTAEYMAAILNNLGISDPLEIGAMIGEDPSYYAQLEVLAKRVYQDQSFYANLYDKPENVARTGVAIRAVELMVEREMFESRLRKEMLISTLLSTKLQKHFDRAEGTMESLVGRNR